MNILPYYPGKPSQQFRLSLDEVPGYKKPDYGEGLGNAVYVTGRKLDDAKRFGISLKGLLVSLSGGIDSSTSAAISKVVTDTYGKDTRVVCVTIGLDTDNEFEREDIEYARRVSGDLGIEWAYRDAKPLFDEWKRLQQPSDEPFSEIDMKARLRSVVASQEANNRRMLKVGSFDRGEDVLNAFSDGLSGAHLSYLTPLYKTEVVEFGQHLGMPEYVFDKKPCGSELGNRDEDLYGTPFLTGLDAVLFMMHDQKKSPEEVSKTHGIDIDWLNRISYKMRSQGWRTNSESLTREAFRK